MRQQLMDREAVAALWRESNGWMCCGPYNNAYWTIEAEDILGFANLIRGQSAPPDPAAEALRAAAPALYEALAGVVTLYDNETFDRKHMTVAQAVRHVECWNRARAALGKAREGAPDRQPPVELVRPD